MAEKSNLSKKPLFRSSLCSPNLAGIWVTLFVVRAREGEVAYFGVDSNMLLPWGETSQPLVFSEERVHV